MSKKKNTLKDLDEFLKQQAATLVSPSKLSDKVEATPPPSQETPEAIVEKVSTENISTSKILSDLKHLAAQEGPQFKGQLYDIIIRSVELQDQYSPEGKMLINTALYLKNGERWKEAIREYWRKK